MEGRFTFAGLILMGQRVMRPSALFSLFLSAACVPWSPIPKPDAGIPGCYRIEAGPLDAYGDSLGYPIPSVIRLLPSQPRRTNPYSHEVGVVLPSVQDRTITWTNKDNLPSSLNLHWEERQRAPVNIADSMLTIPGDSIDIRFHGFIGDLFLRLGTRGPGLDGRAEWVVAPNVSYPGRFGPVRAFPVSCGQRPSGTSD